MKQNSYNDNSKNYVMIILLDSYKKTFNFMEANSNFVYICNKEEVYCYILGIFFFIDFSYANASWMSHCDLIDIYVFA